MALTRSMIFKGRCNGDKLLPSVISQLFYSADGNFGAAPVPRSTPQPTVTCREIFLAVEEPSDEDGFGIADICQICMGTEKCSPADISSRVWIRCECKDKCGWIMMSREESRDMYKQGRQARKEAKARAFEEEQRAKFQDDIDDGDRIRRYMTWKSAIGLKLQEKREEVEVRAALDREKAQQKALRFTCCLPRPKSNRSSPNFRTVKTTVAGILTKIKRKQHPIQTEARVLHAEGFVSGNVPDVDYLDSISEF